MATRLIACPDCGSRFDVATLNVGTKFRCGACGNILIVPPPKAPSRPIGPGPSTTQQRRRVAPGRVQPQPQQKKVRRAPAAGQRTPPPQQRPGGAKRPPPRRPTAPASQPSRAVAAKTPPPAAHQRTPPPKARSRVIADEATPLPDALEPRRDPLLGETLGGEFRIETKLGEGGYGVVYKALELTLRRTVALKVMLKRLTANAEFVGKFLREARTAAALAHPNIVSIHRVGRDRRINMHYLAMEFVDGKTLTEVLEERGGPIPPDEAIDMILQAANGLNAAHEKQIIHRDIKPGNLMITQRGVVKITDFGLAKIYDSGENTSSVIGSPYYMPPEQFEGKARDGRSDIYALGITFYVMLTCHRPFEGSTPSQILLNIMNSEPASPDKYVSDLPTGLWDVIRKMIERDITRRYQDMGEVMRDLRRIYAHQTGGERVFCRSCGAPNQLGAKSCTDCDQSLMDPCPRCGTEDFIGAKFCGNCGCNIAEEKEVSEIVAEALSLREAGRPDRAIEKYRALAKARPNDEEVRETVEELEREVAALNKHRQAVDVAMEAQDLDLAAELLEKARVTFASDPDLRASEEKLADLMRHRRIAQCIEEAKSCLAQARFDTALRAVEEAGAAGAPAKEIEALRTQAREGLEKLEEIAARARALEAEGQMSAAIEEWNKALEVAPKWKPATSAIEGFEDRVARTAAARERVDKALELGDLVAARIACHEILTEIQDDRDAKRRLRAIDEREEEVRRDIQGALRALAQGGMRKSFDDLEELLDGYPTYPGLRELRDHTEALLEATDFFRREARRLLDDGANRQARSLAEVAMRLDPSDPRAKDVATRAARELEERTDVIGKARALVEKGDFENALALVDPLMEQDPNHRELREVFDDARAGIQERERAKNRRKVAELNAALKEARHALDVGDITNAREAAHRAEKIAPRRVEVAAIKRDIAEAVERERKVDETAFFRISDLRKMSQPGSGDAPAKRKRRR